MILLALLMPVGVGPAFAVGVVADADEAGVVSGLGVAVMDRSYTRMVELEDGALQNIAGQEGVSLDIEIRLNTDAAGAPLASLDSCAGGTATAPNPCRIAIAFNNRPGKWLMLKDYYGTLNIPKLYLNKTQAPTTVSAYKDLTRFQNETGGCLLRGGKTTACVDADIAGDGTAALPPHPALKLSMPGATGTFENDILVNLFIGRVAIEIDDTSTTPTTPGYNRDANGTFLGLQLRDTNSARQAKIDIDGHIAMFGF